MGRRNKNISNLAIDAIAAEGKGIGRHGGKVVFVDYALPGDIVDVFIKKNRKDYAHAKITELKESSNLRQDAFCEHYGICGGCKWQNTSYTNQLTFKQQIVNDAFQRIGKFEYSEIAPILGCSDTTFYRNKMEYTFSSKGWLTLEEIRSGKDIDRRSLGFHVPGEFLKVTKIKKCHLQDDRANEIRNKFHAFAIKEDITYYDLQNHGGLLRNLIIRNTGIDEWMVVLSFGEKDVAIIEKCMNFFEHNFSFLTSINYVINTKRNDTLYDQNIINYSGKSYIIEQLGDIQYKISPKSFFQTNSKQFKLLYDTIKDFASIKKTDVVYDLYTGIGSIACYIAKESKHVVGIETVGDAIKDAIFNTKLNKINNTSFFAGEVERLLDDKFIQKNGKPNIVITDPPRAGMHKNVVNKLLELLPNRIVYVSCNPATQARDLQILSEDYLIKRVQPVDMFPHTYHIENIALLERK